MDADVIWSQAQLKSKIVVWIIFCGVQIQMVLQHYVRLRSGEVPTAPSQHPSPREQPQPSAAVPETQRQGMQPGRKGETNASFSVLHPSAFTSLHITFNFKPSKLTFFFFYLDIKEENSVWSLGWEGEKQRCCPYKEQTRCFCWWLWNVNGCDIQISSPSFMFLIHTESHYFFNKKQTLTLW